MVNGAVRSERINANKRNLRRSLSERIFLMPNASRNKEKREAKSETLSVSLLETNDVSSIGFNSTATIAVPPDRIKYPCGFRPFLSLSLSHNSLTFCLWIRVSNSFPLRAIRIARSSNKTRRDCVPQTTEKTASSAGRRSLPRYEIKDPSAACRVQPVSRADSVRPGGGRRTSKIKISSIFRRVS